MAVVSKQLEMTGTVAVRRGRRRRRLTQLALHLGLALWAFHAVYPLVWVMITSLKYSRELYAAPFALPEFWKWSNYKDAWVYAKMGTYFVNSLIVTVGSTILVLALSSTCAFALARFDFRFKGLVWAYILFGFLIPHSILLIPLAIFTREIGLYNEVVPDAELAARASAVARKLAAGPTMGLAVTKRMLEVEATLTLTEALHEEAWVQALCMKHPDYRESYEAFVAKRAPDFTKNAGARVEGLRPGAKNGSPRKTARASEKPAKKKT